MKKWPLSRLRGFGNSLISIDVVWLENANRKAFDINWLLLLLSITSGIFYLHLLHGKQGDPREVHDSHRPIRPDEDLDSIFAWREQRKVTSSLTLHYERKLYLLADNKQNRRFAGKYVDVYQYPDGRIEIKAAGESLPYSTYDKLGTIDQGAVISDGYPILWAQRPKSVTSERHGAHLAPWLARVEDVHQGSSRCFSMGNLLIGESERVVTVLR